MTVIADQSEVLQKIAADLTERLGEVQVEIDALAEEKGRLVEALLALKVRSVRTPIASTVADPELTSVQERVLTTIRDVGSPMTVGNLAQVLNYNPPVTALYRIVGVLMRYGLVQEGPPERCNAKGDVVTGGVKTYVAVPRG